MAHEQRKDLESFETKKSLLIYLSEFRNKTELELGRQVRFCTNTEQLSTALPSEGSPSTLDPLLPSAQASLPKSFMLSIPLRKESHPLLPKSLLLMFALASPS